MGSVGAGAALADGSYISGMHGRTTGITDTGAEAYQRSQHVLASAPILYFRSWRDQRIGSVSIIPGLVPGGEAGLDLAL